MAIDFSKFKSSPDEDKLFDVAPFDAAAAREKMVGRITRALKQVNKELGSQGGKDFDIGHNNQVRYRPTLNGQRIYVEKQGEAYFPLTVAQFGPFCSVFSRAVEAGEYDKQLEAALAANAPAASAKGSGSGKGVLDTLTKVKQSAGRYFNVNGLSKDEVRAKLVERGVDATWIDAALAGLKAK